VPKIKKIYVCENAGDEMVEIPTAVVDSNKGIVGDRYYENEGTFSNIPAGNPKRRDVTFISAEEIDKFNSDTNLSISYGKFRRNILTEGVNLNELLGVEFKVGNCLFFGTELCEPCRYLAKIVHASILPAMNGRSGIRAIVLDGGTLTNESEFFS